MKMDCLSSWVSFAILLNRFVLPDDLHFGLKIDSPLLICNFLDFGDQIEDIRGGRFALIHYKIPVNLADLSIADPCVFEPQLIDELPCSNCLGILKNAPCTRRYRLRTATLVL